MAKPPPIDFYIVPAARRGWFIVEGEITVAEVVAAETYSAAFSTRIKAERDVKRMTDIEIEARAHAAAVAEARRVQAAAEKAKRLARKAQQFDLSELPLFGDGHLQRDLFA